MLRVYKIKQCFTCYTYVKTNYLKVCNSPQRRGSFEDTEMQSDEKCPKSILVIRSVLAHSDICKVSICAKTCEQKKSLFFFLSKILVQNKSYFVNSLKLKVQNLSVS